MQGFKRGDANHRFGKCRTTKTIFFGQRQLHLCRRNDLKKWELALR
jgi:hypothetical protein